MWPLSSTGGGGKALVAGSLKKFFYGVPNSISNIQSHFLIFNFIYISTLYLNFKIYLNQTHRDPLCPDIRYTAGKKTIQLVVSK